MSLLDLIVDKYGPSLHYVEGPHNVIADTFSRLSRTDDNVSSALVGKKVTPDVCDSNCDTEYFSLIDNQEIFETFLNLSCLPSNNVEASRPTKQRKTQNSIDNKLDPKYKHTSLLCQDNRLDPKYKHKHAHLDHSSCSSLY
jgi:hypothetical protein